VIGGNVAGFNESGGSEAVDDDNLPALGEGAHTLPGVAAGRDEVSGDAGDGEMPGPEADALASLPDLRPRVREKAFPAELVIPTDGRPAQKGNWRHGFHSQDVVTIPTGMSCDTCVLYAIRKKDSRHPLACPEGKKHATCAILSRYQIAWVEGLVGEIRGATGRDPSPTDRARVEQIVRLRSRVFAIEVYIKAAGAIDLATGELRSVMDRLNTVEGALTRALGELRQSIADARDNKKGPSLRLEDYVAAMMVPGVAARAQVEDGSRKEVCTDAVAKEESQP